MATLNLTAIWINLMSSGAAVSAQSAQGRGEGYTTAGSVRSYAGGRQRSVMTVGEAGSYAFVLRLVPRSTVDTLRTWAGQAVQVRDNKGRRFFGVYYALAISEWVDSSTVWDLAITLSVVTANEAV